MPFTPQYAPTVDCDASGSRPSSITADVVADVERLVEIRREPEELRVPEFARGEIGVR